VRNTLTGTFNSLDKISSSFGSGLAALSFNQDYMKKKQLRSETEAENVVEGLGQAGNSLYKGLENGITGIFLNPLEGAKEEGISGLIKGTFFGITGFFIKPISAIFDATSKTAIGLKNTVNIEENVKKTLRYKRPFYGVEKFYKEYWREDGEIVEFMEKFKKGKYAKLSFFDFVRVPQEGEKGEKILVIMIEMILLLSVKKKRKDWEIQTKNIRKIETLKDGLLIMLKEKIKKIEVFKKSFLRLF
jgi:vacuolar protein sorting-associated protein 13A/C